MSDARERDMEELSLAMHDGPVALMTFEFYWLEGPVI